MIRREDESVFSKTLIDESSDPQNVGRMSNPDGSAELIGPCGDTMEIYLKMDGDMISQILFYTDGCGPTIACGSMLAKMTKGKRLIEASQIGSGDLEDVLGGLPPERRHCAELAVNTLAKAMLDYEGKKQLNGDDSK